MIKKDQKIFEEKKIINVLSQVFDVNILEISFPYNLSIEAVASLYT